MTDSSSLITTNPIANPFPVTAIQNQHSPLLNGATSDAYPAEEEEYTIKCICGYADDDGNTVYCEKCDTWQHIECYYPSKKVPEEHFCADCLPRDVDAKRAAERQRRHREALEGGDRKVKRPSSKNSKKKHKDSNATAESVNGWQLTRHDSASNGREQPPPAKKPKTSHRTSGSVASINGEARKRASSNVRSYPSPSKSPQDANRYPPIPLYSQEFLELYDRDEGTTDAQGNEHTIPALNELSSWRSQPSKIASAGEQPSNQTPFVRATGPLDDSIYPQVSLQTIERKDIEIDGRHPRWKFITTEALIPKEMVVGEIRGEVGMLDEYCQQQSSTNRWQELGHPDPFVFFHPHMNVYIDSRKAGTEFRYLRRSCTPNITLKTFITEEGDWRHCFVSKNEIPIGKELTAAWFLDPQIMLSGDHTDQDEPPFSRQCDWVSRLLANFGDCACGKGSQCLFARFDRRLPAKTSDAQEKGKPGRKKKPKPKAISPKSTGQATNSRAGSEALKLEDDDGLEQRSSSGSASDPKSRDMTPVNVAALDADPVLGAQLTDREIRKLKALEQREQERNKLKEKKPGKKRTSAGSNLSTPNLNGSKHFLNPGGVGAESYAGSPPPRGSNGHTRVKSRTARYTPPRPVYVQAGTQTSPDDIEIGLPPAKRMKFVTPQQRLLRKVLAKRSRYEERCKMAGVSPRSCSASPMTSPSRDVEMKDGEPALSPVSARSATLPSPSTSSDTNNASPAISPTYPLPSQAAHSHTQFKVPAPRLHLSSIPPVPTFSGTSGTSPLSNPAFGVSTVQSPSTLTTLHTGLTPSTVVTPSPAKKKLSLGEYMKSRRSDSSATGDKLQVEGARKVSDDSAVTSPPESKIMKVNDSLKQQVAQQGGVHENAVDDTPMKDVDDEPEYEPPEPTTDYGLPQPDIPSTAEFSSNGPGMTTTGPDAVQPAAQVKDVMSRLAQYQESSSAGGAE
jgi:uncharacterized protein